MSKSMKKRWISFILCLCLTGILIPVTVRAENSETDGEAMAASDTIKIYVTWLNQDRGADPPALEVDQSESVERVREKIAGITQIDILPKEQILSYEGLLLEDGKTLMDYGIQQYESILVTSDLSAATVMKVKETDESVSTRYYWKWSSVARAIEGLGENLSAEVLVNSDIRPSANSPEDMEACQILVKSTNTVSIDFQGHSWAYASDSTDAEREFCVTISGNLTLKNANFSAVSCNGSLASGPSSISFDHCRITNLVSSNSRVKIVGDSQIDTVTVNSTGDGACKQSYQSSLEVLQGVTLDTDVLNLTIWNGQNREILPTVNVSGTLRAASVVMEQGNYPTAINIFSGGVMEAETMTVSATSAVCNEGTLTIDDLTVAADGNKMGIFLNSGNLTITGPVDVEGSFINEEAGTVKLLKGASLSDRTKAVNNGKMLVDESVSVNDDAISGNGSVAAITDIVEEPDAEVEKDKDKNPAVTTPNTSSVTDQTVQNGAVSYEILDGMNENWVMNSDGSLAIRGSGEISEFVAVKVDGSLVDSGYYTVTEGSTIITLSADYLNTLSEESHEVELIWTDGSASTLITVIANTPTVSGDSESADDMGKEITADNDGATGNRTETDAKEENGESECDTDGNVATVADGNNTNRQDLADEEAYSQNSAQSRSPKTGGQSGITIWLSLLLLALTAFVILAVKEKKESHA